MRRQLVIGERQIGDGAPCFVIAEAGVNHNGDVAIALRLVDAAAAAGADAVKFQTFDADRLVTINAPKAEYQTARVGDSVTQHQMLRGLQLSEADHRAVQQRCIERNIMFLSTPFDEASADMLERLGVPAFKVPSGELTNVLLLEHIARKRKPIILSTGMADLAEVSAAVARVRGAGATFAVLQCTSAYPADPAAVNLRAMQTMADAFDVPVGLSDHTPGTAVSIAAVALGASIVEKHLTLDRAMQGPDHQASLEPSEFRALVAGLRDAQAALGDGTKKPAPGERELAQVVRRSLVAARALPAGHRLTEPDVAAKRPGNGMPTNEIGALIGRVLRREVKQDEQLSWDQFEPRKDDRT